MPYVQRDAAGKIAALYLNLQQGYAEEWRGDDDTEVIAYRSPRAEPERRIEKADIWRRTTDAEAEQIDARLMAQPARLRRLWQDCQYLSTTDDIYPVVRLALVSAFGETRAAELLAPST